MSTTILLLVLQADDASLREREARRIAAKQALTREETAAYENLAATERRAVVRGLSLAIIPLSFSDADPGDPAALFLHRVRDYYEAQSAGAFTLVGKGYRTVPLGCTRDEFAKAGLRSDAERVRLLAALTAWSRRDGAGVLAAHDAIAFVVAGRIGPKESPLWPHEGSLELDGPVRYIVVPSEGEALALGIAAHEFGHLLDLADKYEAGAACLMGTGYLDPPAPLCAPCRVRLGWASAAVVDGRAERKIVLSRNGILLVKLTNDGSESLFFEVRGDRLLAWRAHTGLEFLGVFPSKRSDRLTPFSDPPLVGRAAGAREVWIADIRIQDGAAWMVVGPSASLTPAEEERRKRIGRSLGK